MKLPCKLQASPLKEVIFEIRQEADLPLALMAPGLLFGPELAGMPILNMPANQIPADIRENDPNLKYAALINIKKNNLNLYIGNKSVAFSLSDGYAGWTSFRNLVLPYVLKLHQNKLLQNVQRISLRYINFIDNSQESDIHNILESTLSLGTSDLLSQQLSVETVINHDAALSSTYRIINPAKIQRPKEPESVGCVLDIDTVKKVDAMDFIYRFIQSPENYLDHLHNLSKTLFFGSLKSSFIERLGATYEQ